MRTLLRLLMIVSTVLFTMVAVIKFVMGCSWKESVGIAEELCREMMASCPLFSGCRTDDTTV